MGEIFGFFLAAFIIICFARPVAAFLKIPALAVYIISGIFFGPSGIGLVKNVSSLNYFFELGMVLLMFSAGLELKIQPIKGTKKDLGNLVLFNLVIPGILGLVYGIVIAKYFYIENPLFIALYMMMLISSPASEVVVQLFREFARKIEHAKKQFSGYIVMSSVFADLFSFLIFTIILAIHASKGIDDLVKFFAFAAAFFSIMFKGLPVLHEKILSRFIGMNTPEEETTTLLMLVVIVVTMGTVLQIPAVVCSFFAGISLANVHINRMVRNNINFITSSIFVPIFFIIVGANVNLQIFKSSENFLFALITIVVLMFIRAISVYTASRITGFSSRDSLGFGFSTIPQLTGTIAIGVVFYNAGLLPENLFNSVVLLSIITTITGTLFARFFLFPGIKQKSRSVLLVEDFYTDIKPFNLLTPICDIARRLKYTELPVYPVVDSEGVFKGIIHLDDVKDTMFKDEIACLVISADVVDGNYPSIERDATIQEALKILANPGVYAIPVIETINNQPFYIGMLLLQDILPEIGNTGG
ncbi:MAG: cation:proton antiporter [Candidatus Omnitrophica bacterium]|nr:cation:proton antiporter [Candidatus Omnitrophota bacterium]